MKKGSKISIDITAIASAKFVQILAASVLVISIVQFLRQGDVSENWDKLLFVGTIAAGFVVFLINSLGRVRSSVLVSITAVIGTLVGLYAIEKHDAINNVNINEIFWMGFGFFVQVVIISLTPWVFWIYLKAESSKKLKYLIAPLSFITLAFTIPAVWQGGASLIEPDSPEYFLNELLAVPSGNLPYVDFVQYGILFSWLVAPFARVLNANELVTLGLYFMSFATIIAILIGVWLVYKATNKQSLAFAVLLVVPFTSIAQFPGRESFTGNIFSNPTQVPIRLLGPIVIGVLLLSDKNKRSHRNLAYYLLGLNLWINTDFGLAALISAILLMILSSRTNKPFLESLGAALFGWLSYPVALAVFGEKVELNFFATFIRSFGGGFGAEPIQTPGPVLIILPLIVGVFFASNLPLFLERFRKIEIPQDLRRAVLTSSFFSTWSLIGFAYYLNRSYASGQMQILFLPLSVAMASFFYYIMPKNQEDLPWTPRSFFKSQTWSGKGLKRTLFNLPIALAMALPLGTIIAFPNPAIEVERLTNAPAENRWPLPKNQAFEAQLPELISKFNSGEVAYFGSSGNYVSMTYSLVNLSIFNSPFDFFMNQRMVELGCRPIQRANYKYLILNDSGIALAQNFANQEFCGEYTFSSDLGPRVLVRK